MKEVHTAIQHSSIMKIGLHLKSLLILISILTATQITIFADIITLNGVRYRYDASKLGNEKDPAEASVYFVSSNIGESVTIPKTITVTHWNGSEYINYTIPVTIIESFTFSGSDVKTIIAHNIREIGARAFSNCRDLIDFQWGKDLEIIGESAFWNCTKLFSLKSLNFPNGTSNLKSIGKNAFLNCSGIRTIDLTNCTNLKEIGERTFSYCSGANELKLPSGLEKIGNKAFEGCEGIEKTLYIPQTVIEIGESAFARCKKLSVVKLDKSSLSYIPNYCFADCISLKEVSYNEETVKMEYIGDAAFGECSSLTGKFDIPRGVQELGEGAFAKTALTEITYYKIRPREKPATYAHSGLKIPIRDRAKKTATIPTKAKSRFNAESSSDVGNYAYLCCENLTAMPDNMQDVGNGVFAGCSNIKTLVLPHTIRTVSESAINSFISKCYDVSELNSYMNSLHDMNYYLYMAIHTNMSISKDRPIFTGVRFHPYVETIDKDCLASYPIKTVVFGHEDQEEEETYPQLTINDGAFSKNTGIDSIKVYLNVPPKLDPAAFPSNVYENACLIVPDEVADEYKQAEGWKLFKHLATPSGVEILTVDSKNTDVYNLEGVLVVKNASAEQISQLPKGLYIIGGKKRAIGM